MPQSFLISDYAVANGEAGNWWRGYLFRVAYPIRVSALRCGMVQDGTGYTRYAALYEADGVVPQAVLASGVAPEVRGGELSVSEIDLKPDQDYIFAQGASNDNALGKLCHYNAEYWDTATMVSSEDWLDYWKPVDAETYEHQVLCWRTYGDADEILGKEPFKAVAHNQVDTRPDLGLVYKIRKLQAWCKVGGQWKEVVDAWCKIGGNWKEIADVIPKIGGNWKD